MTPTPSPAVLLAVGHDGASAGVAFAAREALLAGVPLHLVHVVRFAGIEPYAEAYDETLADADAVLAAATARARHLTDDAVTVRAERIDRGALVPNLVRRADESRMIVLQHRRVGPLRRLVTGSTTKGVAARAGVPVVSLPEDWEAPEPSGRVTVAVQDSGEATSVLRTAHAEASLRSAHLTVLHASWLDDGADMLLNRDPEDRARTEARARGELAAPLATCAREFPDVEVDVAIRFVRPAEALVEAAVHSDLLVLGRRHHLMPLGSHLGPVARTVLDYSRCPVMLAPEEDGARTAA